ncbi:MAG: hypothetical protein Q9195_008904 [Heterodermia aff. obscurata]
MLICHSVLTWLFAGALWLSSASSTIDSRVSLSQTEVQQELTHRLSDDTKIYFPSNAEFANYTERWSESVAPDIAVVAVPATAQDVATTIKFANAIGIPFYVVNTGHGTTISQLKLKHGIEISMRSLVSIAVAKDGKSAVFGGGVFGDEVIKVLDAKGKVTVTGTCTCVGILGPALGGGFGRYMGFYGLATDQIISLDVVLADGSLAKASATSNPDLYWGMRGAGHNFGVVTQFHYKIHDRPTADWYYTIMFFTADKLEKFFELLNALSNYGKQPKEPVILFGVQYAGTAAAAQPYLAPFVELGPVLAINDTVPYPDLAEANGNGVNSAVCQPGKSGSLNPVGLKEYNVTATRAVYSLFKEMVTKHPDLNESIVQLENYPVQKMKTIDAASTAYPHRSDNVLASFTPIYDPSDILDPIAARYADQARALFDAGELQRPLTAYVNYANGKETVEQVYGYEAWRQQKLRALKKKYDPENRFRLPAGLPGSPATDALEPEEIKVLTYRTGPMRVEPAIQEEVALPDSTLKGSPGQKRGTRASIQNHPDDNLTTGIPPPRRARRKRRLSLSLSDHETATSKRPRTSIQADEPANNYEAVVIPESPLLLAQNDDEHVNDNCQPELHCNNLDRFTSAEIEDGRLASEALGYPLPILEGDEGVDF